MINAESDDHDTACLCRPQRHTPAPSGRSLSRAR